MFRVFLGCSGFSWECSGFFRGVPGFSGVPECSGVPVFLEVLHAVRRRFMDPLIWLVREPLGL